jgi:hypothetical protein
MLQTKKLYRCRRTHLPLLLARRHRDSGISREVNPRVRVVLDGWDLPRQPSKEVVIEGLHWSFHHPVVAAMRPICIAVGKSWHDVLVPPLRGLKKRNSLKEETSTGSSRTRSSSASSDRTICQLPLHAISSSVVLQSNICAFKHWTAQFICACAIPDV